MNHATRLLSRLLLACGLSFCACGCHRSTPASSAAGVFNIRDYGAVADGQTVNTRAIQQAIDLCAKAGGGSVVVPAGRFVTGTIFLASNVTLHLDGDAVLVGSPNGADYSQVDDFKDGNGVQRGYVLVGADGATDVSLEGEGAIDGNASNFDEVARARHPFLVRCVRSQGVRVAGIRLQNPGAWSLSFFQCHTIDLKSLTIRTPNVVNLDGIDLDSCQDVQVSGCDIDSGDDCICLKTTSDIPTRNVVVSECVLKSSYGAFKIGSESFGDFDNIVFQDSRILGAAHGGIKLFSVDGAHISNVGVYHIAMSDVTVPIMVRLGSRLATFRSGQKAQAVGSIKDVHILDIDATNCHQIGAIISGIPNHLIDSIDLRKVSLQTDGGGTEAQRYTFLDENESAFPDTDMFGTSMPVFGLFLRHVALFSHAGLNFTTAAADARKAAFIEDVNEPVATPAPSTAPATHP